MTKVRIKNLKSVFNAIDKVIKDTVQNQSMYNDIAKFAETRVVQQTRAGKDLTSSEDGDKQPELSEGYIKFRNRVKSGKTDIKPDPQFFRPRSSNLTLTGQLLKSIRGTIVKSKRQVVVEPTGNRDDGLTNKEVASDLAKRGRTFLGLDKIGIQRIRRIVLDVLRRNIRNFNK